MTFEQACAFVGSELGKVIEPTEEQQLNFYGLFKQAKEGNCNVSKPWGWNFVGVAKWKAWKSFEGKSSEQAKQEYIDLLTSLCPTWQEKSSNESKTNQSGSSMMSGGVFSRPIQDEEVNSIDPEDKTIFDIAEDGNLEKLKKILKKNEIDATDSSGRTLLHIVCDRGYYDIAKLLINDFNADVNVKEMENHTPLHFAALCEEGEIIQLLLNSSADASIKNSDGETPKQLAEGTDVYDLFP